MGFTNTPSAAVRSDGIPAPLGIQGAGVSVTTGFGFVIPAPAVKVRIVLASLSISPPAVMDAAGTGQFQVGCTLFGQNILLALVYATANSNYPPNILTVPIPPRGLALDAGTGLLWSSTALPTDGTWNVFAQFDEVVQNA
jgi:hypothetical protein